MAVTANASFSAPRGERRGGLRSVRWGWLATVAAAHAGGIVALSGIGDAPERPAVAPPQALLVRFVTPAEPTPPAAPPAPQTVREAPEPPPPPPPEVRKERPPPPAPAPTKKAPVAKAPPRERPAPPAAKPEPPTPAAETEISRPAHAADGARTPPSAPPPVALAAPAAAAPLVAARYDAAYLHNPRPAYPRLSRHRREEGQVVLRVHVLSDGSAESVEIAESSSHPRLDKAALEAVHDWRFIPARRGETAVDSWLRVPIVFRLEE